MTLCAPVPHAILTCRVSSWPHVPYRPTSHTCKEPGKHCSLCHLSEPCEHLYIDPSIRAALCVSFHDSLHEMMDYPSPRTRTHRKTWRQERAPKRGKGKGQARGRWDRQTGQAVHSGQESPSGARPPADAAATIGCPQARWAAAVLTMSCAGIPSALGCSARVAITRRTPAHRALTKPSRHPTARRPPPPHARAARTRACNTPETRLAW